MYMYFQVPGIFFFFLHVLNLVHVPSSTSRKIHVLSSTAVPVDLTTSNRTCTSAQKHVRTRALYQTVPNHMHGTRAPYQI